MQEGYNKETKLVEKTEIQKEVELIRAIIKTREELKSNKFELLRVHRAEGFWGELFCKFKFKLISR